MSKLPRKEPSSEAFQLRRQYMAIQAEIKRVSKILEYQTTDDGKAAWQKEVTRFEKQKAAIVEKYRLALTLERAARRPYGR